jgi:hypothetical protein
VHLSDEFGCDGEDGYDFLQYLANCAVAVRHNVPIATDWTALSLYFFADAPGSAEWVLK